MKTKFVVLMAFLSFFVVHCSPNVLPIQEKMAAEGNAAKEKGTRSENHKEKLLASEKKQEPSGMEEKVSSEKPTLEDGGQTVEAFKEAPLMEAPVDTAKVKCKDDCDCVKYGMVCHKRNSREGTCELLNRVSMCPKCSDTRRCQAGRRCVKKDGTIGKCAVIKCHHDCDCVKHSMVCESGRCQRLRRPTRCVSCSKGCLSGDPCLKKDGSIGTCPAVPCKHDCDCVKMGMLCDGTKCARLRRMSRCLSCSGACKQGEPCFEKDRSIGICKKTTIPCKHDCDCRRFHLVCDSRKGACAPLRRPSNCKFCHDPQCKKGEICYSLLGIVSQCTGQPTPCTNDCDCYGVGLVCDHGTICKPLKRQSYCRSCDGACKTGSPCIKKDYTIGICGQATIPCKHDCDCFKFNMVCDGTKCAHLKRLSRCYSCSSSACIKGQPCYKSDKSIGVCTKTACCINDPSICPKSKKCCPKGGQQPPPGVCSHACITPDPSGNCPIYP